MLEAVRVAELEALELLAVLDAGRFGQLLEVGLEQLVRAVGGDGDDHEPVR